MTDDFAVVIEDGQLGFRKLEAGVHPLAAFGGGVAGSGVAGPNGWVKFECVVQQRRIAIERAVISPIDFAHILDGVGLTIITHKPERAKILRFEDGSPIPAKGISEVTYTLTYTAAEPHVRRVPIPTAEDVQRGYAGSNWFVQDGKGYVSAEYDERVILHVHNRSEQSLKVLVSILYRVPSEEQP